MTEVAERGTGPAPSEPCYQIRAAGLRAEQLALEARAAQMARQELLGRPLVPWRIDGVEADQPREQLLRLGLWLGRAHPQLTPISATSSRVSLWWQATRVPEPPS